MVLPSDAFRPQRKIISWAGFKPGKCRYASVMSDNSDDPRIAAALARNDRYQREFVEAFSLCPYSRRCRETGKLQRTVLLDQGGGPGTQDFDAAAEAIVAAIARLEKLPPDSIEVGLLVLPALDPALASGLEGARNFEQLVRVARERMQAGHARGEAPFHCVAFHPHFPEDLADEHRAVRFIRRSPDPTVQLVRASLLSRLRHGDPSGAHYVDTAGLSAAELMAVDAPVPVAARIGQANLCTLNQANPDRLRELLAEIRMHARPPDR
ncbi:MAG: hypothetical protein A3H35_14890 [Betaproteobacteria bacterium RIFCSPLOWO2_02_FULL_62_17]|nr:MAG: hypothetical protein A3H35_14890 [Betaproteobacteria bacterium RIFCSPLOWO2_02_FULL_62_17]